MMFRRVAVKKRLFGIVIASLCGFTILQTRNHAIKALMLRHPVYGFVRWYYRLWKIKNEG